MSNSLKLFIDKLNINSKLGRVNDFARMKMSLEGNPIWTVLRSSSMGYVNFETYSRVTKSKMFYLKDLLPLKLFYFEQTFHILNQPQEEKTIKHLLSEVKRFSLYLTLEEIRGIAAILQSLAQQCNFIQAKQFIVEVINILISQK